MIYIFGKKIAIITGTRAEFGLLKSTIDELIASNKIELIIYATGIHLLVNFGNTIKEIEDSYNNVKIIPMYDETIDKDRTYIGKSISKALYNFTIEFEKDRPDIIVVLGDRVEILSACIAAATLNIPIAHIHGGDISDDAQIDGQIRHAVTKISHLHFTATYLSAQRVLQMGEEEWRVKLVGAPGMDEIYGTSLYSKTDLCNKLGLPELENEDLVLCVQHPNISEYYRSDEYMRDTIECLRRLGKNNIIIYPNNDPGHELIIKEIEKIRNEKRFYIFKNLDRKTYLSLIKHSLLMIGNSSSGIIETAPFNIPVINIGVRNLNRECSENVLFVKNGSENIWNGIKKVFSKSFQLRCKNAENIYGNGRAGEKISRELIYLTIDKKLLDKKFILK